MMTAGKYLVFRNKIDPILRACTVLESGISRVPEGDLAVYQGKTSFTSGKTFYFSISRAKARQRELLAICRELPKMSAVLPGSACTITSLELVKGTPNRAMLNAQFEAAEQFFALLTLADISAFRTVKDKSGLIYLNADIMYDFKELVTS
ncbi:MAG: hypothetical protein K2N78_04770 [Oscillospiraceae bacterium]|nr:hypothetical protein [Oscillospiraceae bacterium]